MARLLYHGPASEEHSWHAGDAKLKRRDRDGIKPSVLKYIFL